MRNYPCCLFDCDGTLIDTVELIYRCFVHTCGVFKGPAVTLEQIAGMVGLTLRDQFRMLFGELTGEQYAGMRNVHMDHQMRIYRQHLRLFPGVAQTLARMKERGRTLGVVTSRMPESTEMFLQETGIRQCFDVLVTALDTAKHKPEPEPVLEALRRTGAAAGDTLFIGDASFDIECGARAGVDTAFVAWSRVDPRGLNVRPTYIVNTMDELIVV